ncbi:hypothetical protein QCE73_32415, partial [Caballeronia sp. LZ029]|nr:hypothetical protein [Caballeronia sp. LZ029]
RCEVLRLGIAVSLVTFFAAAKKVTAAPHRGNANRPTRNQASTTTSQKTKARYRTDKQAQQTTPQQPKTAPETKA